MVHPPAPYLQPAALEQTGFASEMVHPFSWALYARLGMIEDEGYSSWAGLFTRPAILALADTMPGGLPVRALNRACRILLDAGEQSTDINIADTAASLCGFSDPREFRRLFRQATGWEPEDWYKRFSDNTGKNGV